MIVLDTTVLLYALGADHRFREPCQTLIAAIADGALVATTTPEVLQEFTHVRARRTTREQAADDTQDWVVLLDPLLTFERHHLVAGLQLFRRHPQLGSFDAMLAAVCLSTPAATLVSADSDFDGIAGLPHVIPDADGVAELLAS